MKNLLAILLLLLPCALRADRPNVLLICIDDLRPVLGCYGGAAKTTSQKAFYF